MLWPGDNSPQAKTRLLADNNPSPLECGDPRCRDWDDVLVLPGPDRTAALKALIRSDYQDCVYHVSECECGTTVRRTRRTVRNRLKQSLPSLNKAAGFRYNSPKETKHQLPGDPNLMTTPPAINDIQDLYNILETHPQWQEALRRQLLTTELLAMPEQLVQLTANTAENSRQIAELSAKVDRLAETVAENSRQIAQNSRQIAELSTKVDRLAETVAENSRQIAELSQITRNQTTRMNRMESDMGDLKARFTETDLECLAQDLVDLLDLASIAIVSRATLIQFSRQLQLPVNTRRSFNRADLVCQARDSSGHTTWCAVEISWTVAPRDLERARRNADLLRQATGQPAHAFVAGHRYEEYMDWTNVQWIDLSD